MSSAIRRPRQPAIEYPDSDGKPMSDNTLQYRWIVTIKEGAEALYREDPNVFVAGDLLWYAVEGEPAERIGPDVLIAFGRPKGERGSYMQWIEGGIAPQVVFEILSPGNRAADLKRKFEFYDRHGVEEYYIYDPDTGDLEGWRRRGGRLRKIGRMAGYVSPRLGIRFRPGKGPDNLTILRPDGERFKTFQEVDEERLEARRQRDEAVRRADEVARQRDDAADRAARYAAKLRAAGIEPD
jgi:Uma2 family endonuclease